MRDADRLVLLFSLVAFTFQHPGEKDRFSRLNKNTCFMVNAWLNLNIWNSFFKTNRVKIVVSQKPVVHGARDLIRM